jgi:predicted dehydrogenase
MRVKPVKIGVVGCGNICSIYFQTCSKLDILDVAACADLLPERAAAKAEEFNVPRACSVEEILADPDIEIILNLTIPNAHADVAFKAIDAGKSVYNEKPLTISREDGKELLRCAREKGVLVGCAPDTFLGAGLQTCRDLIDCGAIGTPVSACGHMLCHGHESWHPDPEFYYKIGGGPMFDMGPYYLTALIHLMGPVHSVAGQANITFAERTITSEPKKGTMITVDTPTHIAGLINFTSGAVGTIITSFDVWAANMPLIEVYGTEGSLSVPDPNGFGGPMRIWKQSTREWEEVKLMRPYEENSRGIGVADMAYALRTGGQFRANGDMAYHVLDIMHAFHDSSNKRTFVELESTCTQPAPLPVDL